jgi:hemoglobin
MAQTLYARLGGYDAIAAVCDDLLPRMMADPKLGRFWKNRGKDGMRREKQLLVDFLCASAGGPLYYVGRDMKLSHEGHGHRPKRLGDILELSERHARQIPGSDAERAEVIAFIDSTKRDIVE